MEPPIFAIFRCICNHFRDFLSNFDAKSESFRENTKTKTFVSTLLADLCLSRVRLGLT
jgi:hypothetical protein